MEAKMQVIFDPNAPPGKKGNIYRCPTILLTSVSPMITRSKKHRVLCANRGEAVHSAIELLRLAIDGEIYDDMCQRSWKDSISEKTSKGMSKVQEDRHRCSPDAVEERFICGQWAGTADFVGEFDGKKIIIDWKTSKKSNVSYDLQLGAYCTALSVNNAAVALLDENGCEPTIVPMSDTAIDRWNKVVEFISLEVRRGETEEGKRSCRRGRYLDGQSCKRPRRA
jgi:predicted RecB family nuclease